VHGVTTPASSRPLLVIVSGAPATGKTTLVQRIAPALGLFVLAKDDIKETLGEALPPRSLSESQALGLATFKLLFHLARQLAESGVSLALEGAFYRGYAETDLAPVVARARSVLIHCCAQREVCVARFRERHAGGQRHPVHFDSEQPLAVGGLTDEAWERLAEPLDLKIPTLVIDTTRGYVTDLDAILAFIRSATCGSTGAS